MGLANKVDPVIAGWMHGDEPDNAQETVSVQDGKFTDHFDGYALHLYRVP